MQGRPGVQPRLRRTAVDLDVAVDYAKDVTAAFDYQRAGTRLAFPLHFHDVPQLSIVPGLRFDQYFDVSSATNA